MKNRKILAALAIPCLGLALSAPLKAQPLKDAVEQTLKTSPDVLSTAHRRLSIDQEIKQARGGYFPKIDLNLGYGRERSDNPTTRAAGLGTVSLDRREAGITLNQMLFDGFFVKSEVERHTARADSAAFGVLGASENTALKVVDAYLEVLRRQELVKLTKDNQAVHQRTFDQIKLRSESGVGRKADMDQILARLALAQANVMAAESNAREAEITFQRVVGKMPQALTKPGAPDQAMPKDLKSAIGIAMANHPILKSAMADVEAAQAQHRTARSLHSPRLDLELGYNDNNNISGLRGDNESAIAMLRVRYNLFRGGSDEARVGQTASAINEATEISHKTMREVEESISLSWNAYTTARERLAPLKQHSEAMDATREAYTKQFNIGQRTLLDLLDAENEYFTARSNHLTGQYIELFGKYRVLASSGKLLESLQVAPPAEAAVASAGKKSN
jgi:adhesin transport system outer membrane protein